MAAIRTLSRAGRALRGPSAALFLALSGCSYFTDEPGFVDILPPAHDEVELRLDSDLGIYYVVGYDDHYFHGNRYYRYSREVWWVSPQLKGPWASTEMAELPAGLYAIGVDYADARQNTPPAKPDASTP